MNSSVPKLSHPAIEGEKARSDLAGANLQQIP